MQIIPTGFFVAMPGGTFIDTGEGNEWADALLFPPWLPDRGDGTCFYTIAFLNPPATLKGALDAGQQCPEAGCDHAAGTVCALALCPGKRASVSTPFHSPTDTDEGQQDVI